MAESSGAVRREEYNTERLEDVRDRVARIEGRLDSLATREDVANAKLAMYIAYTSIGVSILVAIGTIAVRIWLG